MKRIEWTKGRHGETGSVGGLPFFFIAWSTKRGAGWDLSSAQPTALPLRASDHSIDALKSLAAEEFAKFYERLS